MKKKLTALVLAVVMVLSLTPAAFAAAIVTLVRLYETAIAQ